MLRHSRDATYNLPGRENVARWRVGRMGPDKRRRPGEQSRVGARAPGVKRCRPLERWCSNAQRPSTQLEETDDGSGGHEGWTQTTRHCCLCRKGRPCLINRPCSRTGENPPYGIPGRAMETSASCEARSAPSLYPTAGPKRHGRRTMTREPPFCLAMALTQTFKRQYIWRRASARRRDPWCL